MNDNMRLRKRRELKGANGSKEAWDAGIFWGRALCVKNLEG